MLHSSKQLFTRIKAELHHIYDVDEASSIAFLLMEHLFKLRKTHILADKKIDNADTDRLEAAISRLKEQEPIQYVIGQTDFYGRPFIVNSDVLIPRPETEELVDWIITEHQEKNQLHVMDIGTGSGCIAISLALSLANAIIYAVDISEAALAVAKQNAILNEANVHFVKADILHDAFWNDTLDVVVSNPPYVKYDEQPFMRRNVLDFEPHLALFVKDTDPLLFYRHIIQFCVLYLTEGGNCYFEVNEQFASQVQCLFYEYGFTFSEVKKDTFGKDRFVKGVR